MEENKIQDFLGALFRPGEIINIRMISAGAPAKNEFIEFRDDAGKKLAGIIAKNQPAYNIYFGANPRQYTYHNKMVSRVSCAFTDIDSKDYPSYQDFSEHCKDLIDKLQKINLIPSIIVNTGHGIHLYWVFKTQTNFLIGLDEAENQCCPDWKELQKALIVFCHGDKCLHDLPRILRIPESLNVKDPKKHELCQVAEINDIRYSRKDFKVILDLHRREQKKIDAQERAAIKDFQKNQSRDKDDLRYILIEVLSKTEGVCDHYDDFINLALAFKAQGLTYEEVDPVFQSSHGYNFKKNKKIYDKLKPKKIGLGTAYHYAKRHNPALLEEKIKGSAAVLKQNTSTPIRATQGEVVPDAQVGPKEDHCWPEIEIQGGKLPWICDQAEMILARSGRVYQRNGFLVKIIFAGSSTVIRRDKNEKSPIIQVIDMPGIVDHLTRIASWYQFNPKKEEKKYIDCPKKVAETIISRGQWKIPELTGVISAPTLRPDGTILQKRGYDKKTGLLLIGKDFPQIKENPDRDDAIKAVAIIKEVLKDVPFKTRIDRSVMLAAILTAMVRKSLETAPLFGFTAPKMGSGKTLLTDVMALVASGKRSAKINQAQTEEEEQKRLLAVLMEGDEVVCIDNIKYPLESEALCTITSETEWSARVLGINTELKKISTNTTWTATGNNLRIKGDLSTRAIMCQLDPGCERPEEREFPEHLRDIVKRRRFELIDAALTILRAYHVAGKPKQALKNFARYEEWSRLVRHALVWIDQPDPCNSRRALEEDDPDREAYFEILSAWYGAFEEKEVSVHDVKKYLMMDYNSFDQDKRDRLKISLLAVADAGGEINDRKLGTYFREKKDRIEGKLRLQKEGKSKHGVRWSVRPVWEDDLFEKAKTLLATGGYSEGDVEENLDIPAPISGAFWNKFFEGTRPPHVHPTST